MTRSVVSLIFTPLPKSPERLSQVFSWPSAAKLPRDGMNDRDDVPPQLPKLCCNIRALIIIRIGFWGMYSTIIIIRNSTTVLVI